MYISFEHSNKSVVPIKTIYLLTEGQLADTLLHGVSYDQ
jgi:hypothetical protein